MKLEYITLKTGYWFRGNQKVEVNILIIGIDYGREFKKSEYEDISNEPVRL